MPVASPPPLDPRLVARLGQERLAERLNRQAGHKARLIHQGAGLFILEKYLPLDRIVACGLALTGLLPGARANHLAPRLVERSWCLPRLPAAFEGFRLLQLSDLHLDDGLDFTSALLPRLAGLACDAIVITGDFRFSTHADLGPTIQETQRLLAALPAVPRYAVLGNHDPIELVAPLEAAGLRVLLNEAVCLERDTAQLWLAGIDDPHFYQTHDLAAAAAALPAGACTVLLAHSPEIADQLPPGRFDLVLCGHTHGGQLCLPGGQWIHVPLRGQPCERIRGAWQAAGAHGYTSVGTGSCGVAARLNCPGEYTLHTLQCG
jgi:uncharacterized protein